MKQVLRIKIHQPNALYRIPFSYKRRLTYPIPPYSTVKGLICNLMGIKESDDDRFRELQRLSLAIYGRYESLVKEYVWFRNLKKESYIDKFHTVSNRIIDKIPQSPGGQIPVVVDVLHNVDIIIYIYHADQNFLKEIKEAFEYPYRRNSTIHLGRSEDWLVLKEIKLLNELKLKSMTSIGYFTTIPELVFADRDFIVKSEKYQEFFIGLTGNLLRLPTFYVITEDNQRIFNEYITVKLYDGGSFKSTDFYVDEEENLPIILSKLSRSDNGKNLG